MRQLEFDWSALTQADLRAMLAAGLVEAAGTTLDKRVISYRLTAAGRCLLANQVAR